MISLTENQPTRKPAATGANHAPQVKWFILAAVAISLLFFRPLAGLIALAFKRDLFSHIPLIPFMVAYLIWQNRTPASTSSPTPILAPARSVGLTASFLSIAAVALGAYAALVFGGRQLAVADALSIQIVSYLGFLFAAAAFFLGSAPLRQYALPLSMMVFAIPFPTAVEHAIEMFFQYTSAEASAWFFAASGMPVLREGLVFQLPGITIQVAQECSGIRSSLVLFITSLVAGYMFLKSPWRRAALTAFVIPLGIVRNAFRIWTISLLCVHVHPSYIDSPIHRRGGPIFFLLSLIPFFLLLWWLRRREQKQLKATR